MSDEKAQIYYAANEPLNPMLFSQMLDSIRFRETDDDEASAQQIGSDDE